MTEPEIAPYGSWRQPDPGRDRRRRPASRSASPGSTATTSPGSRAGRPRPAGASSSGRPPTAPTRDLTPAPINVRDPRPRVRRRRVRGRRRCGRFSDLADGRLYRLDPGVSTPIADHARRTVPLRRPAVRRRRGAASSPSARTTARRARRSTTIVDVAARRRPRPARPRPGPDFVAAPRALARRDAPGLAGMGPPGHALGRHAAAGRSVPEDGGLGEPTSPPAARTSPSSSRSGRPTASSTSSADRSGWWNLYRLVDGPRLEPLAPMEAEFADPAWLFGRSSYAFLPDGSIVAVGASRRPRSPVPHRARRLRRRGRDAVHRAGGPRRPADRPSSPLAGRPGEPRGRRPARPRDAGAIRRAPPGQLARARRAEHLHPGVDRVPDQRRADRPRALLRAAQPGIRGAARRASAAASSCRTGARPRTPRAALNLAIQLLTSRGIAVVDVDYGGSTGYGRDYRRAPRRRVGHRGRRRLRRGRRRSSSTAATSIRTGWRSRAAAPAATRRSPRSPSATSSRPASACFGVGDLRRLARETHKFESRYLDRLVGPYPAAADALPRALADPLRSTTISCPSSSCRGSTTGSCRPAQAEAIADGPAAGHIPHRLPRVRGRGPWLPRRRRHPALARGGALVPRPGLRVRARRRRSSRSPRGPRAWRWRRSRVPRHPDGGSRHRRQADAMDAQTRSSSSCSCSSSRLALAYVARRIGDRLPDPARPRRPRARVLLPGSACPDRRAPARAGLPAVPAADPVRGRATSPRSATSRRTCGRSACWRSGSCCSPTVVVGVVASALIPGSAGRPAFALGAIVAPPDAVAATAIFRRLGVPTPGRHDPRGREPHQRRVGADRLPVRRGRGRHRVVLARRGRASRSSWSGSAASSSASSSAAGRRRPGGGPTDATLEIVLSLLAPLVAYLPAEALGPERRPRDGGRRAHRGPPAARALSPGCPPRGPRRLERPDLPHQRVRVHAHRPAAAGDPRRAAAGPGGAGRARRGDQPDGDRGADRLGLPGDLPAAPPERADSGRRPVRRRGRGLRRLVGGDARRGLARGRAALPLSPCLAAT